MKIWEYFYSKILIKYSSSVAPLHRDISTELTVSVAHPRTVKADSRDALQCPHWQTAVRRAEDLAANICSNCVINNSISFNPASKQREKCRWQCSSIAVDLSLEKEGIKRLFSDDSDTCASSQTKFFSRHKALGFKRVYWQWCCNDTKQHKDKKVCWDSWIWALTVGIKRCSCEWNKIFTVFMGLLKKKRKKHGQNSLWPHKSVPVQ